MNTIVMQLIEGLHPRTWEWDGRFGAALMTIKAPEHLEVLPLLEQVLPHSWNSQSIAAAPEPVQALAKAWRGLMPGQRLYLYNLNQDPLLFAAWWPWGGGTTFSLRVSCQAQSKEIQAEELLAKLRHLFLGNT